MNIQTIKKNCPHAWNAIGGLSKPSKMPGFAYGLPAGKDCKTGSKLSKIPGTICHICYAQKGMYIFPTVKNAQRNRLNNFTKNYSNWFKGFHQIFTFLEQSKNQNDLFFRWHDSGELQSRKHFRAIISLANLHPKINFWLPTREYQIVIQTLKFLTIPENLTIRFSAHRIGAISNGISGKVQTSTSGLDSRVTSFQCPARNQDNQCQDCRACWDKKTDNVNYKVH